ncbi:hypothetical protein JMM81_20235 [Bacillus sp. V3B]|uniref:DUF5658 family protein n=1 Tax=Bacillus sp. V3B TaxID=2804915 RepID=UPI00210A8C0B|nr:DUF5658 family protein [Bacillus sp. V3B]MCQ6277206.1 hypothetical protein [Bacillus sp. V3B]
MKLNLVDAFVTFWGLEISIISELNPLMDKVYEINPILFILIKISLSLFLYLFIIFKIVPQSHFAKGITVLAVASYTSVFGLHFSWITLAIQ